MGELIRVFIGALILGVVAFCLTIAFNAYQSNGSSSGGFTKTGKKNKKNQQIEQVAEVPAEQQVHSKPIITPQEQELLNTAQNLGKKGMDAIDKIKKAANKPTTAKQQATFAMGDNAPVPIDLQPAEPPTANIIYEEEPAVTSPPPTAQTTVATQQYALKTSQTTTTQKNSALRYINDVPEAPTQTPNQIAAQYRDGYNPQGKFKIQLIILTRTSVNLAPYYAQLADLGSVYVEPINSLQVRILLGNYNTREDASTILKEVRKRGFKDAFLKNK